MSLRAKRSNLYNKFVQTRQYVVYIASNSTNRVYYTGVTNNLVRRISQHKEGFSDFTSRYHINKLVYFETYSDIRDAIEREKQIKAGSRKKKFDLIMSKNPTFRDLYTD